MLKEAICQALGSASLEGRRLQQMIHEKHYPKQQILFYQDDEIDYVYFVIDGVVVADHHDAIHYHELLLPNLLFPLCSLEQHQRYPYEALALTDVIVWRMRWEDLRTFLDEYPHFYRSLTQDLLMVGQYLSQRNDDLINEEVAKRVELVLCQLLYYYGKKQLNDYVLPWPVTVTEISYLTPATRSTTSHVLQKLKQQHKVYYENKKLAMTVKEVEQNIRILNE